MRQNPQRDKLLRRILVFAPSFYPAVRAGGPARSLTNLVRELESEFIIDVVTSDRDLGEAEPFAGLSGRRVTRGLTTVYYLDTSSTNQIVALLKKLARNRYDLIVVNSIWEHRYALTPVLLASLRVLKGPVLLLPRGELEPGALALKSRKKRLAGPAFRAAYRHGVSVFGATSRDEADNIRAWFPGRPVVTTTNDHPDSIRWGEPTNSRPQLNVLFLSRVDRKKGLRELLRGLQGTTRGIHLSIVGPANDPEYWQECEQAITQLPEHVVVTRCELAERHEIPSLLWNADCMVLLTAGENYGHVIAESLQAGCPVITTPTTPWTDVIRGGGGKIVENRDDAAEVARVLDRWAGKTTDEFAEARHQARAAFEEFSARSGPNVIELALAALYP